MKQGGLSKLLLGLVFVLANFSPSVAETGMLDQKDESVNFPALKAQQAGWIFSGIVSNERGERYNYYFQLTRNQEKLHAIAALIDSQSKEVLLYEDMAGTHRENSEMNWQVGRIFLQFNPVANSWIFGVKTRGKKEFNFRVDMLTPNENLVAAQTLRPGMTLVVNQTGRLTGHLQVNEDEQFIMATRSWFKQLWLDRPQLALNSLTGILCQFNDGSGFYSMKLPEIDALTGAVAGWRDAQGISMAMSQFVTVKATKKGVWRIQIAEPDLRLSFTNALPGDETKPRLIAGLVEGNKPGFCTVTKGLG